MAVEEAIILAGGLGTRLRAAVNDLPKALAPVAGQPFLAWLLDELVASGIRRSILATGYMADKIKRFAGDDWAGMEILHSVEERPLGTAGAVRRAVAHLQGSGGAHVMNGDTYLRYRPVALECATLAANAKIGIALAHVSDVGRYGAVEVRDGKVASFREKAATGIGYINAGCYFLTHPALQMLIESEGASLEKDFLLHMVLSGDAAAFDETSDFIDIGVPADLARAQTLFDSRT